MVQPAFDAVHLIKNSHPASQPTSEMAVNVVTIPWLISSEMSAGGEEGVGEGEGREKDEDK